MALGSVSIPPFTRAEFKNAIKKAMYSEGVIVFSGAVTFGYRYSYSVSVPDTVDYVILKDSANDVKLARGGSAMLRCAINPSVSRSVTFSSGGTITTNPHWVSSAGSDELPINVTGYHYY